MDKDQIEAIKARRNNAYTWITTLRMDGRRKAQALLVEAETDITALVNEVERLGALLADETRRADQLESELAVYRITVLGVNVAAGQGED